MGPSGNKFTITGNNNVIQGNFWHGFSGDSVVNNDNNVITGNASLSTGTIIDNGSGNIIENNRL